MEKITPFDIPLLNNEISQYLSRKDLTRCVLVSKAWAGCFSPALWRDLDCRNNTPDILILTRQQEHIRTMRRFPMECDKPTREQLASLRLQRLEIIEMSLNPFRPMIRILHLLERIPTLQHLQITLPLDIDHIHQQHFSDLGYLSLKFMGNEDELEEEDRKEYEDAREAIRRMPPMRLRELTFNSYTEFVEEYILQSLFERCPRVEKLHVVGMCSRSTLEHLTKTLKENKLPELRHLILESFEVYSPKDKLFDELMSSITHGLESFGFDGYGENQLVRFLIPYHSRSLTRLDLINAPITLSMLSDLMTGLPCLRTVKAQIAQNQYSGDILPFNRDWRCVDMTTLQLDLRMWDIRFIITDPEWKESTEKACLDHVFSQVGKLKSLQLLNLGCDIAMYVKKHGYLEQLAGLKQLKILDLTNTLCAGLGKQEALWMVENWPKLLQVNEKGLPEVFKKTLRMKRPLLEIVFIDDDDGGDDDSDDDE
ncbi:MAG: hypothetical protein J3Q66DRAFT_437568 [Benniella sp.]|nr:MAG: hypothetical protein J3Q66DRAFT_437568 [Benniella sp.]